MLQSEQLAGLSKCIWRSSPPRRSCSLLDFEGGFGKPPKPEDLAAIQAALERAGVEFIESGVR
jgi:hypothetical protein